MSKPQTSVEDRVDARTGVAPGMPREPDIRVVRSIHRQMLDRGFRFNTMSESASMHIVEDLLRSAYQYESSLLGFSDDEPAQIGFVSQLDSSTRARLDDPES